MLGQFHVEERSASIPVIPRASFFAKVLQSTCVGRLSAQSRRRRECAQPKCEAKESAEAEPADQEAREASKCNEIERHKNVEHTTARCNVRVKTLGGHRTWSVPRFEQRDARAERSNREFLFLGHNIG